MAQTTGTAPDKTARRPKKHTFLKILLCIAAAITAFLMGINLLPPPRVTSVNPFLKAPGTPPMIAAHRGGGVSNPENTLMAFRAAVDEFGAAICETDVWLTADGRLVYSHDESINRVACPEDAEPVVIAEHTLGELRAYNMGYNFVDPDTGELPYRDLTDAEQEALKLKIPEFRDLLAEFYDTHKDLLFIIEIKDSGEAGYRAADLIARTLEEEFPDYAARIVLGTFHPEIEDYLQEAHPALLRGGSTAGAAKFIISQMLRVNRLTDVDFDCLQIPMEYTLRGVRLDLTRPTYVRQAHRRNIAVQYWTINDPDDMRALIALDADAIMTDDPKLLRQVIEEYGN